ncbi:hypothetical protein BDAP_002293 [Binucleata daphniae]
MENNQEKLKKLDMLIIQIKQKLEILIKNKDELVLLNLKIKALLLSLNICIPKQNSIQNTKSGNISNNNITTSVIQNSVLEQSTNLSVLDASFLPLKESTFFDISSFDTPHYKSKQSIFR